MPISVDLSAAVPTQVLGGYSAALAWDGGRGRVLVSNTYAHGVRVVDVAAAAEGGFFPTALDLVDLALELQLMIQRHLLMIKQWTG